MKRTSVVTLTIIAALMVCLISAWAADTADTTEGTIKTVDTGDRRIEVENIKGRSWIFYDENTKWPKGVVDPSSLVSEDVMITFQAGHATKVEIK